jgi:hypothetical protein
MNDCFINEITSRNFAKNLQTYTANFAKNSTKFREICQFGGLDPGARKYEMQ